MDASRLRPLGIGEILDTAINIYRARFATLVKAVVVVVAPVQVLAMFVELSVSDEDTTSLVGGFVAFLLLAVLSLIANQLATATSLQIVSNAYMGQETDWRGSLALATSRLGTIIGVTLMTSILAGLALLACIAPGVYLFVAWGVVIPVVMLDKLGAWASMERSQQLVKGHWFHVFGGLAVSFILSSVVSFVLQGIFVAVLAGTDSEFATAVLNAIAGLLSSAITTPFTAAVVAVLYFDLRVRKEGFDLEMLARTLGNEPPPPGQGPGPLPRPPSI